VRFGVVLQRKVKLASVSYSSNTYQLNSEWRPFMTVREARAKLEVIRPVLDVLDAIEQ
jgi:hypothetical protein